MSSDLFGPAITHDHLQELAQRLLKGPTRTFKIAADNKWGFEWHSVGNCMVVASEMHANGEYADAIGWTSGGWSTLIECKASRSDFLRDSKKYFRRNPEMGIGMRRFYLTAPDVINEDDDLCGWGHIEAYHPSHLTKLAFRRHSDVFECDRRAEIAALIQATRMSAGMIDHRIGSAFVYLRPWPDDDKRVPEPATAA